MSHLYLTSAAADAEVTAGSGTKWKAGFTPGASATHLNKNSVAGPTAPLQATDGAAGTDGTAVAFYTPPLWGVTIAGAITCSLWTRENATANNVAPTIRIERCSGDGTVLSTIVAETTSHGAGEMPTTAGGASDTISVTAGNVTDTTLSDGDRLRITLWIDDASGQGGTGSMASGGRGEFWVNGPNGAQGQAQLAFTEIVCPQAGPHIKQIVESTRATTDPNTAALTGLAVGDELYIMAGGDQFGANNDITDVTVSATAGSIGSVTDLGEDLSGSNVDWIGAYLTTAGSSGSATIQLDLTRSGGTPGTWHFWVTVVAAGTSDGHTIVTKYTANTTQVVSLTVPEAAAVLSASYDWDSGSVGTPTPGGSNAVENSTDANLTENSHYWLGQPAGTRNYGTTGASGTVIRCHGIVIEGAAGGQTGTASPTQAADTASASGVLVYSGTAAPSQAANTSSGSGSVTGPVSGTAAPAQAAQTATATGVLRYTGTAAPAQAANTAAASGKLGYTGTAAPTQAANTANAAGTLRYSGTSAATQAADTASASGLVTAGGAVVGSAAAAQASQTAAAVGVLRYSGTAATAQAGQTASGVGVLRYTGTGAAAQGANVGAAAGLFLVPITGTAAATQAGQAAAGSGVSFVPITGSVAVTQAGQTAAAVGSALGHLVPRPDMGTTPRPGAGFTARPSSGAATRPGTGTTPRPFTGTTPRP